MWSKWKARISGDVPLLINPSQLVLNHHRTIIGCTRLTGELMLSREKKLLDVVSLKVLRHINLMKPMMYQISRLFLDKSDQWIIVNFFTNSVHHADFFHALNLDLVNDHAQEVWTFYHASIDSDLQDKLGLIDDKKQEVWLYGSFPPDSLLKVLSALDLHFDRSGELSPQTGLI